MEPHHVHVPLAIVGSGFGGLGTAIRLEQAGFHDYVVFERSGDVGGVWRDNTYPGCACDIESHLYSFSFARNPSWTRTYAGGAEIQAYLRGCAARFCVLPKIRFHHEITSAAWDAEMQRWQIETTHGAFSANVLVAAVGGLSEPAIPALRGLDTFEGTTFHSARWNHAHDLTGRRVAVIGTGASSIQFVPRIQPRVSALKIFQRTAPWIIDRGDRPLSAKKRRELESSNLAQWLERAKIYARREVLALVFLDTRAAKVVERLARKHLEKAVPDAALRAKLTPTYVMGCKRVLLSDDYFRAVANENVDVVTDRIAEVRPDGVMTNDGVLHAVDTIIFATGFQVQTYPFGARLRGRHGRSLTETWKDRMTAHRGTTVAGFPNLFLLQGPNTALGHSSVITMLESQIEHVVNAVRHMDARGLASVEPHLAAQEAFVARIDKATKRTVWVSGGCQSWYLDKNGKNSTIWPGFTFTFKWVTEPFNASEYAVVPRGSRPSNDHPANPRLPGRATMPESFAQRPPHRPLSTRVGTRLVSGLSALPANVQILLSGGKPIVKDGHPLAPDLQLLLAGEARLGRPMALTNPVKLRADQRKGALLAGGRPASVGRVLDIEVDGGAGRLRARHYAPVLDDRAPLLVFLHGGGFVFGDLDTHDAPCRLLCRHGGMHVLAIDYRLAPENPFPAAVEDARAALRWAQTHAAALGADVARVGIGGDSAGANLAAVVAQLAATDGGPTPVCQMLIYPAVDRTRPYLSTHLFAEGFFLTRASIEAFHEHYVGRSGVAKTDPRIGPLHASAFAGLAPALVVTAGFDPLRDEGEAYAAALVAGGTTTVLRRFDALTHGFFNAVGVSPSCRDAVIDIARATHELFDVHPARRTAAAQPTAGESSPT